MLQKFGVDISRLSRQCRQSLNAVEKEYNEIKEEAIITSTYESNHGVSSLHYCNEAYDVRPPKSITSAEMLGKLKKVLGNDFDILYHEQHFHIEHDPKKI